jgi:predicted transcriptional regulator
MMRSCRTFTTAFENVKKFVDSLENSDRVGQMSESRKCHCCKGSGEELDNSFVGKQLRINRINAGIGLRKMARRLKISPSFLSNLEKGKRTWTMSLMHKALKILGR